MKIDFPDNHGRRKLEVPDALDAERYGGPFDAKAAVDKFIEANNILLAERARQRYAGKRNRGGKRRPKNAR